MTASRTYRVFGLVLRSDLELDVLEEIEIGDEAVDLEIVRSKGLVRFGPYHFDPYFLADAEEQYFHWRALGAFLIPSPDRILVDLYDNVPDDLASHALLGIVMAMLLERRARLSLHASAVSIGGRAVVLMGDKKAGKSTTSGALMMRGYTPISDDLVPVAGTLDPDGQPVVSPGFSSIKLYSDSIEALGLSAADTDREIHPSVDKVQKRMPLPVGRDTIPLGPLFVLRRTAEVQAVRVVRLPAHEALGTVMRYAFLARFGATRLGAEHLKRHLRQCAGVVSRVPVFDIWIPEDLGQLPAVVDAIVAEARATETG